jgi:hypothetical protein
MARPPDNAGVPVTESGSSSSVFRASPLAVSYPSPLLLLNYPLVVTNVKLLCERDTGKGHRGRAATLSGVIRVLRETYHFEGWRGLYRGGPVYLLHQAVRDTLRFLTDSCASFIERRCLTPLPLKDSENDEDRGLELVVYRRRFVSKLALKYCIDMICYPILLLSTRAIVLNNDQESSWDRLCLWCREEGFWSLFGGVTASLLSSALEEAMDMVLSSCIDRCASGTNVDLADRLVLKACGGSVVSIFTAPINYVGVIQRCQSNLPGLLKPRPLWPIIKGLPWRGSFNQLLLFGGILGLNVRLIQWKLKLQAQEEDNEDDFE